jgi:citrate synthase
MWETGISKEDLIGNIPFASVFFLLLKSRLPDAKEAKMIDALITSSVDHGVTPPSTHTARLVASAGVPLPSAVAAGMLAVGDVHGGAIEDGAKVLQEWVQAMRKNDWSFGVTAEKLVDSLRKNDKRMPGFGHRIHTKDPRTARLFALAGELGFHKDHVKLSVEVEKVFAKTRALPINVDGAIAAVISDMEFDWHLGKAFFLIGRVAGMIAHVYEEMTTQKPMRRMCVQDTSYNGPWERPLG